MKESKGRKALSKNVIFGNLFFGFVFKIWPLAQHLPDSLITRANFARPMSFFPKKGFGQCLDFGEYHVTALGKFGTFVD